MLQGTVDEDRSSGERSDGELADMIMEAKRRCDAKNREEFIKNWELFGKHLYRVTHLLMYLDRPDLNFMYVFHHLAQGSVHYLNQQENSLLEWAALASAAIAAL